MLLVIKFKQKSIKNESAETDDVRWVEKYFRPEKNVTRQSVLCNHSYLRLPKDSYHL